MCVHSKSEAIKAQFVTAIAAVIGTAFGLLAQRNKAAEEMMLGFSSGGFLYIATVNILPEIVKEKSGFSQTICEIFAFVFGIGMMLLVALYE